MSRETQGGPGRPKGIQGGPGRSNGIQGGPGRSREVQGGPGRLKEVQRGQKGPGRSKGIQESPGRSREVQRGPGKCLGGSWEVHAAAEAQRYGSTRPGGRALVGEPATSTCAQRMSRWGASLLGGSLIGASLLGACWCWPSLGSLWSLVSPLWRRLWASSAWLEVNPAPQWPSGQMNGRKWTWVCRCW